MLNFEYNYNIKPRESFFQSRLKNLLDNDYNNSHNKYKSIINNFSLYRENILSISFDYKNNIDPFWINGFLPIIDGIMLYCETARLNPRYYFEVGSGNSTKFVAKSIRDNNLRTKIISIDPNPRSEIDALCYQIIRSPLEEADLSIFHDLTDEDMLIVDSSHRVFPNSDVMVFFCEILPSLPPGLVYAIHDIAFPYEVWCERCYNEQYMLATWLLGGGDHDKIHFPTSYLSTSVSLLHDMELSMWNDTDIKLTNPAGFFWLQRGSGASNRNLGI